MNKKQSLFHIAKRDTLPWYKAVLIRGGAIVLALIVCAIVTTLLTGENPIKVYSTILYGAFGTSRKSWVTFHNLAILLVAILTGVMYIYLNYSKHGYEIAVVGESQRTASYAGIKVERVIVRTMILSGAICGLIGLLLTAGTDHTLTTTIVGGRGFTAVMVSWMAKFNPIMMIFTSLLIVVLSRGASEISSVFGLNHSFADILTGIILFFIIGSEFFISYKVSLRKSKKEA